MKALHPVLLLLLAIGDQTWIVAFLIGPRCFIRKGEDVLLHLYLCLVLDNRSTGSDGFVAWLACFWIDHRSMLRDALTGRFGHMLVHLEERLFVFYCGDLQRCVLHRSFLSSWSNTFCIQEFLLAYRLDGRAVNDLMLLYKLTSACSFLHSDLLGFSHFACSLSLFHDNSILVK